MINNMSIVNRYAVNGHTKIMLLVLTMLIFVFLFSSGHASSVQQTQKSYDDGFGNCTTHWVCSIWGDCINGIQNRTCTKANLSCIAPGMPSMKRNCNASSTPTSSGSFTTNTNMNNFTETTISGLINLHATENLSSDNSYNSKNEPTGKSISGSFSVDYFIVTVVWVSLIAMFTYVIKRDWLSKKNGKNDFEGRWKPVNPALQEDFERINDFKKQDYLKRNQYIRNMILADSAYVNSENKNNSGIINNEFLENKKTKNVSDFEDMKPENSKLD